MTHQIFIVFALGAAAVAAPASAGYVRATYSGTVQQTGINAPAGLDVGTPINFTVVYDPAKFVDYTAALNGFIGTSFTSALFDSLSDDPKASLRITAGPVIFNRHNGIQYGTPFGDCSLQDCGPLGLHAGNLPSVEYLDGSFAGVGNIFINRLGFSLDADPIAYLLSGGFSLDGPGTGPYAFYIGAGDLENPFAKGYAVGNIDLSTLKIAAVPEPAALALLGMGAAALVRLRAGSHRSR